MVHSYQHERVPLKGEEDEDPPVVAGRQINSRWFLVLGAALFVACVCLGLHVSRLMCFKQDNCVLWALPNRFRFIILQ